MTKYIWAILVALLLGATFYAGYRAAPAPTVTVKTVDRAVEKVVYRDRKATTTTQRTTEKRPDGTEVTHETTTSQEQEQERQNSKEHETSKEETAVRIVEAALPDYSLAVKYRPDSLSDFEHLDTRAIEMEIGRRVLGGFWIEAGSTSNGHVSMGVRYEW